MLLATTTLFVVLLGADPTTRFGGATSTAVSPEEAAAIALDTREAEAEVQKKYGNKKPSELTNAERVQMVKDQAAAENRVLEKHGVDAHTWARQQMAKSPKEVAAQKELEKQLAEKREAAAKAAKERAKDPGEIPIQRGISDANPVTLEQAAGDGPTVENGLPADAAEDQAEAAGQAPAPKSTKGSKGGKRGKKR